MEAADEEAWMVGGARDMAWSFYLLPFFFFSWPPGAAGKQRIKVFSMEAVYLLREVGDGAPGRKKEKKRGEGEKE